MNLSDSDTVTFTVTSARTGSDGVSDYIAIAANTGDADGITGSLTATATELEALVDSAGTQPWCSCCLKCASTVDGSGVHYSGATELKN